MNDSRIYFSFWFGIIIIIIVFNIIMIFPKADCWLKHKPSFPAETLAVGFDQHKPVLK